MKRLDLHTHAKVSKTLSFKMRLIHQMVAQARRVGLDGLALVEHFHARNFWGVHAALGRKFSYSHSRGVYQLDRGFCILTGAELRLRDNERAPELVLLGTLDQLGDFSRRLPKPPTRGYRPSFTEAMSSARETGLFVIGAHMFRPGKELAAFGRRLGALDALEANGEDFKRDDGVYEAAHQLGLPVVGGSDAHFWPQIGIKATVLPIDDVTQATVTRAIRRHLARVESLDYGPLAVQISGAYKRILKSKRAYYRRTLTAQRRLLHWGRPG